MIRTPGADRVQTPHPRLEEDADASLRPRALDELPRPDHAADALAVAICHANSAPMRRALAGAGA